MGGGGKEGNKDNLFFPSLRDSSYPFLLLEPSWRLVSDGKVTYAIFALAWIKGQKVPRARYLSSHRTMEMGRAGDGRGEGNGD